MAIDLNKRKKDIRKFINIIENSIIKTLKDYKINAHADRKNIGIWTKINNVDMKIGAIGIKVKKWIAYHGFSINVNNDLSLYKKIAPCGIRDKGITSLKEMGIKNFNNIKQIALAKSEIIYNTR